MSEKPSVGRMVHYVSYGTPGGEYPSVCRAAIISEVIVNPVVEGVNETKVSLVVLNPEGLFFNKNVPYSEDRQGGTWHWPERV